jgi:ATP-dependent Clp protease ATP-binding subunit ClpA
LSLRESQSLGHNYIGTEHILLGLVRENDGVAANTLRESFDLDADMVRNEIIRMLSGPEARYPGSTTDPEVENVAGMMVQSHTLRHTLREFPERPVRALWPSMVTGAALLGLGILIGRLVWG